MPLLIPVIALGIGAVGGFALSDGVTKLLKITVVGGVIYYVVSKNNGG